jgi:hypothetical protein
VRETPPGDHHHLGGEAVRVWASPPPRIGRHRPEVREDLPEARLRRVTFGVVGHASYCPNSTEALQPRRIPSSGAVSAYSLNGALMQAPASRFAHGSSAAKRCSLVRTDTTTRKPTYAADSTITSSSGVAITTSTFTAATSAILF